MTEQGRTRALAGLIRRLRPSELRLFREHLLRLDHESRHDRFNSTISDEFVADYADRCFATGATVLGYVENGKVLAAAELHEQPQFDEPTGEIAFSVERKLQRRGVGTELDHVRMLADQRGVEVVEVDELPYSCVGLVKPGFRRSDQGAT